MSSSLTDCSHDDIARAARKLGFLLFEGKRHTKVKERHNRFVTTIPRHRRLKREVVQSIISAFIQSGIPEKVVRDVVRC